MRVKGIIEEDFTNYKRPSMFISTCFCNFKCCKESGLDVGVCQNAPLAKAEIKDIKDDIICKHYISNPITNAIVFGGLEPLDQFQEVFEFVVLVRDNFNCDDDIVIYTGYYPEEVAEEIKALSKYKNIIIKFGRYIPNKPSRYDDVLGIELASDNQFAERIS